MIGIWKARLKPGMKRHDGIINDSNEVSPWFRMMKQ